MEFDRLVEVWRQEPEPAAPPVELAPLLGQLEALDRSVRRRDRLEIGSALLMLPLFAWMGFSAPTPLARIGALVTVLGLIVIPIRLLAARRLPFDRGNSVAGALHQELDRVLAQERLLRTVLWWYLAPLGLGASLLIVGSTSSPWIAASLVVLIAWLYAQIWRLNRRAIERELQPRIRELVSWLASLEAGSDRAPLPGVET